MPPDKPSLLYASLKRHRAGGQRPHGDLLHVGAVPVVARATADAFRQMLRDLLPREYRVIPHGETHYGSVAFTIGAPNWLFIPLPIAIASYDTEGEWTVFLFNVGALLAFWIAGVWIVRGGKPDLASVNERLLFREFRARLPFGCGNQGTGFSREQVPFRLHAGEQRIPGAVPPVAGLAPRPPVKSRIHVGEPVAATFAAEQAGSSCLFRETGAA